MSELSHCHSFSPQVSLYFSRLKLLEFDWRRAMNPKVGLLTFKINLKWSVLWSAFMRFPEPFELKASCFTAWLRVTIGLWDWWALWNTWLLRSCYSIQSSLPYLRIKAQSPYPGTEGLSSKIYLQFCYILLPVQKTSPLSHQATQYLLIVTCIYIFIFST